MGEMHLKKIQELLDELSVEEQFSLIEHLLNRIRPFMQQDRTRKPKDLYGIWKNYFPADLDVDAELMEIRRKWENEWPE